MNREQFHKTLHAAPAPLFSQRLRLGLLFSAKSGCTYGVKWFFSQLGFLPAAEHYHRWIHRFREEVFYRSESWNRELPHVVDETTRTLRLVREPYARCASSFLHAVKYGYDDARISRFLGRPVDRQHGFSFAEFVDFLEAEDLRNCNIHHRLQAHELELEGLVIPTWIVRLEDGKGVFRAIEEAWGLQAGDHDAMRASKHNTHRADDAPFCGRDRIASHPQDPTPMPPAASFYDEGLRRRVRALYAEDFVRYGYDPELGP